MTSMAKNMSNAFTVDSSFTIPTAYGEALAEDTRLVLNAMSQLEDGSCSFSNITEEIDFGVTQIIENDDDGRQEMEIAKDAYDQVVSNLTYCLIPCAWMDKCRPFLLGHTDRRPTTMKIENRSLLLGNDLQHQQDFYCVGSNVWNFLSETFGFDVKLQRNVVVSTNENSDEANERFQELRKEGMDARDAFCAAMAEHPPRLERVLAIDLGNNHKVVIPPPGRFDYHQLTITKNELVRLNNTINNKCNIESKIQELKNSTYVHDAFVLLCAIESHMFVCGHAYYNDQNMIKIVNAGIIPILIRLMKYRTDNVSVLTQVLHVLEHIADYNKENTIRIGSTGGIPPIVNVMKNLSNDINIQRVGSALLWSLSHKVEEHRITINALGGRRLLKEAMKRYPNNSDIQNWASRAINCLEWKE